MFPFINRLNKQARSLNNFLGGDFFFGLVVCIVKYGLHLLQTEYTNGLVGLSPESSKPQRNRPQNLRRRKFQLVQHYASGGLQRPHWVEAQADGRERSGFTANPRKAAA